MLLYLHYLNNQNGSFSGMGTIYYGFEFGSGVKKGRNIFIKSLSLIRVILLVSIFEIV